MNNPSKMSNFFHALLKEDWLAVVISFLLILLAVIGLLGPNGLNIIY